MTPMDDSASVQCQRKPNQHLIEVGGQIPAPLVGRGDQIVEDGQLARGVAFIRDCPIMLDALHLCVDFGHGRLSRLLADRAVIEFR